MTLEVRALYQELVLEHGKHPRNVGPLEPHTHEATAHNPLCGDRITLRLRVRDGRVDEVRFEARGCMIARASASLLTEAVAGRSVEDALALASSVDALVNAEAPPVDLGALESLRGVREFPTRKECVTLAWGAMTRALSPRGPMPLAGSAGLGKPP
jgi:nitrogen fixation NifU-like protein